MHHWLLDNRWGLDGWWLHGWWRWLDDYLDNLRLLLFFFRWLLLDWFDIVWLQNQLPNNFGLTKERNFLFIARLSLHLVNHDSAASQLVI